MKCPKCKNKNTIKRGKRYNKSGTKQLYFCNRCEFTFMKRDGFEKMRYKKEYIVKAIHLHNEGLSLFQVQDYLWQHEGVKVTRQAVGNWCNKYSIFLKSDK
jgi:transposase-like protein